MIREHKSDCAVHNRPYTEAGPCDCGAGRFNLSPLNQRTPASGPGWTREGLIEAVQTIRESPKLSWHVTSEHAEKLADLFLSRSGAGVDSPKETYK